MLELRAIVHGRVHGVGFRAITLRVAQELHLKGVVCNRNDGTVEIIAQGERTILEELISKVRMIFGKDHIQQINLKFVKPEKIYANFSII